MSERRQLTATEPGPDPPFASSAVPIESLAAGDGLALPYRFFPAASGTQRGSLVYLHGIQSHGGWYVETAAALAGRGYSVLLPDLRGSGVSTGPRGDFPSRSRLVDDVRRLLALSRERSPDVPTFLVGGCWGARPAVAAALEEQRALAGLVLVCPALKVKVDLSLPEKLKVLAGRLVAPRARVPVPLAPEMFTRNPPYLDFIRGDELSLREATARFFFETFLWDRELARRHDLKLPLLLLQSGDDPIVDHEAVLRWFESQESGAKETIVYPEFGHILDFEPDRERYRRDLADWLDRVAAGSAPLGVRDPERALP